MKPSATLAALSAAIVLPLAAQEKLAPGPDGANVSLKLEIERALEQGAAFLKAQQDKGTGSWGNPENPAFTALAVSALVGDPALADAGKLPDEAGKGYGFLLASVQSDGGIYRKGLATYNTALSVVALAQSGEKEHLPVIAKARRFLVGLQQDYGEKGVVDNVFDGGIGYGGSYTHSDLSNTHLALEALYYSKKVLADTEFDDTAGHDLDWKAAIEFVSATQNSEASAKRLGEGATVREEDKGGFVYFPGNTKSEEIELEIGGSKRTALRSYGSMTYAGLLSFIYADLDLGDPRLVAALDWLQRNYTLDENPGMEAQGLYYYYHTMSKALALSGTKTLVEPGGRKIDWKKELALKLMEDQQGDGSWINQKSKRWMEDNPVLVTAYAMLALEHIHRQL